MHQQLEGIRKSIGVLLLLLAGTSAFAQSAESERSGKSPTEVLRISSGGIRPTVTHPLERAIEIAREHDRYIRGNVRDYTCVLAKRERVDGILRPAEQMYVRCRHEQRRDGKVVVPFSVYMKYLAPRDLKGREVLYVAGRDQGDLLVRKGGRRNAFLTWWVAPDGKMAMRDNRYPITEFGFANLTQRLIEAAQRDLQYKECEVKYYQGAKVDDRVCLAIEVRHPVQRDHFRFHIARIFIDDELHVPIHYEAYSWPEEEGGVPVLLEQYTYQRLRLNVGLSDAHYDRSNPEYGFRKDDGSNG